MFQLPLRVNYSKHVVRCIIVSGIVFGSQVAHALPDFIRYGYPGCGNCHYAPNGGGVLTPYGRGFSTDAARWGAENEGRIFWNALGDRELIPRTTLDPILQFNFRQLAYVTQGPEGRKTDNFTMARELTYGLNLGTFSAYATTGLYYKQDKPQTRTFVLQATNTDQNILVRFGRFRPSYGLRFDDHTLWNQRNIGFDEGSESPGIDVTIYHSYGSVTIGKVFENNAEFKVDDKDGVKQKGKNDAIVGTATWTPTKTFSFGGSIFQPRNRDEGTQIYRSGLFMQLRKSKNLWVLFTYDKTEVQQAGQQVIFGRLGLGATKGLSMEFDLQSAQNYNGSTQKKYGLNLRFIPRPHFEFLLTGDYKPEDKAYTAKFTSFVWL